ncbi:MAG: hypothetical protein K5905_12180 [Roseibium sp.]|uniref:hypothetical protein n=1 Tax=Roseibium sp. TaxID=1936156 RepID=UPI0026269B4C|nr:hypothetical protein [Roseibium sp.]MCV0426225.1 hypothetical protein [Roseibium sp.]
MNRQINNTRPTNSPDKVRSNGGNELDVTRRLFLKSATVGAIALPLAVIDIGNEELQQDSESKEDRVTKSYLEFSGPGQYLIKDGQTQRVFHVKRAPWMDCKTDGRFYSATAVNADAAFRYYTDAGFADVAIRKLASWEYLA